MNAKQKLSYAIRLVPDTERPVDRNYRLYQGNLYFDGDASSFIVTNFLPMPEDSNVIISYQLLDAVTALPGELRGEFEDENTLRVTNGKGYISGGVLRSNELPKAEKVQRHRFEDLPDILRFGRGIFSLVGDHGSLGAQFVGDESCLVFTSRRIIACVVGEDPFTAGMSHYPNIISSAIAGKARIFHDDEKIHFYTEVDDTRFYSTVKKINPSVPKGASDRMMPELTRTATETYADERVHVDIDIEELVEIVPAVDKISGGSAVNYQLTEDALVIEKMDTIRRNLEYRIPVKSDGRLDFMSEFIGKEYAALLTTAVGKSRGTLSVDLYPTQKYMVLRHGNNDGDNVKDAFVIVWISPKTAAAARVA